MAQTDDQNRLTPEEEAALKQYVREHPGSTLLKGEPTAKYILRERLKERGETPVQPAEIAAKAKAEESWKYGRADWSLFPELEGTKLTVPLRLPKQYSAELWDALERFVQLSDTSLADFKARYPAFLPARFYDAAPHPETGLSAWQTWRNLLREAWHSGFHPEYVAQLANIPTGPLGDTPIEPQPVCDAQRAVLAMMLESWRARFCPKCGVPFVARKAADKYWPKECFAEQRREKQRASKRNRARKRRVKLQKVERRTKQ